MLLAAHASGTSQSLLHQVFGSNQAHRRGKEQGHLVSIPSSSGLRFQLLNSRFSLRASSQSLLHQVFGSNTTTSAAKRGIKCLNPFFIRSSVPTEGPRQGDREGRSQSLLHQVFGSNV